MGDATAVGVDLGPPGQERLSAGRRAMVERHLKLAYMVANELADRVRLDNDERESAALLGLCRAARGFDEARGLEFSTYAYATIEGVVKRADRDHGRTIRVPKCVQDDRKTPPAGTGPRTARARAGATKSATARAAAARAMRGCSPLPAAVRDDRPSPADEAMADEEQARFRDAVDRLPGDEREAILDRLAGLNQCRSAARLGVSLPTLRARINRGVARLREELASE